MKPEGIKVGDYHPVLARVGYKNKKGNYGITIQWGDGVQETRSLTPAEVCAMFSICETKPKYDPCRLFKKGDKVRVVERYGRKFWSAAPETIYSVVADEYLHDDQNVLLRGCVGLNDGKPETLSSWNIPFFHLELVTPVEELEPYSVAESDIAYCVCDKDGSAISVYYKDGHPHAKEAAEDERDRLNAEYRKKQNNG